MQVIYRPNGPYKWFGIIFAVIIVVELLIILLVSTKPLEPASDLCAIFVIGLALCVYLIRQSFKEIIISEESITIRNETKEKQVFSWESLTHAYLRAGYRRKAVVLSRHELTDDGINRLFHLTLADRLVRKECIVIPPSHHYAREEYNS